MKPASPQSNYIWKFFRAGGFDQVRLDSGTDLLNLEKLDQKLWVALACPTGGLEIDSRTLALIDTDHDGRIRAPELIAAIKWTGDLLKRPDDLVPGSPALPLDSINDATPAGGQILDSAKQILTCLGKVGADTITLEDVTNAANVFAQANFNGDGIVPPEAAPDEATRAVMNDIMGCFGADTTRGCKPGISQEKVDRFFADAKAYSDWWEEAENNAAIFPLNESTASAAAAVKAVKSKVDDYFTRCRLAAFDPRALNALNREEKEYLALAAKDLTLTAAEIAGLPLARIEPGRPLPLEVGLNPAWAGPIAKLRDEAVKPLLGSRTTLTEGDWTALAGKLDSFEIWLAGKTGASVEKLGIEHVREILAGESKAALTALIAKDKALEPEVTAIEDVEKLVRYHGDLHTLCNNFVSFRDFYSRKSKAIFQAGTLYLDQRSCDLCLKVEDIGKHSAMAAFAGTYLAYCDCVRKGTGEKMQIVAAFTDGDSDYLMAGRNGLFYDRKGRDWDATITKVIDNPISIRQAFWSPYKKLVRMFEERVAQRASAADTEAQAKLAAAAKTAAEADKSNPAPEPKNPESKRFDVGVIAAMGVALGAIGTFLAAIFSKFLELTVWQIALVILGIIIVISGPSMAIAYLKLRKRTLGPILDANAWAINAKARLNVPFARILTQVAVLPVGAHRDLTDQFPERRSPWPAIIILAVIAWIGYWAANRMGYIYDWTHGRLGIPRAVKAIEKVNDVPPASNPADKPPVPGK
ncbi:MAG: hypothetical protein M1608_16100 [Candidatus Omnitrophica bacterium]|nr:hypothetical protein [Candidatus Omnitrophota bacterium]